MLSIKEQNQGSETISERESRMKNLLCEGCGESVLPGMRICPQCGGRAFSNESPRGSLESESLRRQSSGTMPGRQRPIEQNLTASLEPARHFPRLIAAIIDSVFSQGGVYIVALVFTLFGSWKSPETFFALNVILGLVISTLYYSLQHASKAQATVGKRLMGLRLVTLTGERVSLSVAVLRIVIISILVIAGTAIFGAVVAPLVLLAEEAPELQIAAAFAFLVVYLVLLLVPYLMIFGNKEHQSLFDTICKTRVVEA